MKKHLTIFTALLFVATLPLCNAMNNTSPISRANIIREITVVKSPYSVTCFPGDKIVIAGSNSLNIFPDGSVCTIYNFSDNTEIPITNYKLASFFAHTESVAAHPNKKIFAVHSEETLAIYDIDQGNKLYEKILNDHIGTTAFNPINSTILIGSRTGMDTWNYDDDVCKRCPLQHMSNYQKVIMHPTQPLGIIIKRSMDTPISTFKCNTNDFFVTKNIPLPPCIENVGTAQYSADGSLVALGHDQYQCSILNLQSKKTNLLINNDFSKETLCGMAFSPISFIVATLSLNRKSNKCSLQYGNAKTIKFITTTSLQLSQDKLFYESCPLSGTYDRLNFFCDGTKLVIALHDKCLVVEVPFEARYQPDTKEKCAYALWMLKNYKNENGDNMLPQDITNLLLYNLLKTHKYSIINY